MCHLRFAFANTLGQVVKQHGSGNRAVDCNDDSLSREEVLEVHR